MFVCLLFFCLLGFLGFFSLFVLVCFQATLSFELSYFQICQNFFPLLDPANVVIHLLVGGHHYKPLSERAMIPGSDWRYLCSWEGHAPPAAVTMVRCVKESLAAPCTCIRGPLEALGGRQCSVCLLLGCCRLSFTLGTCCTELAVADDRNTHCCWLQVTALLMQLSPRRGSKDGLSCSFSVSWLLACFCAGFRLR